LGTYGSVRGAPSNGRPYRDSAQPTVLSRWARSLVERRGYWRAVIAIAAKNARMCWAVLQRGENFKMPA